ncbi:hypothetical protein COE56_20190 [Bacillus anthracis]|nr:hypothetical protein COE56_20190 [Bacillus anthracis]
MRSFGSLIISTVCSVLLVIWNVYEFFSGLMYHQEVRWLKLICMAIMIIGFMDIQKKLKNKDYRVA